MTRRSGKFPRLPDQDEAEEMVLDLNNLPSRLDGVGASEYLEQFHGIKRSPQTLAKYRSLGGGPKFRRAGRAITYELAHLDEYAGQLLGDVVSSTSEYQASSNSAA